jgi:hypothetical protein
MDIPKYIEALSKDIILDKSVVHQNLKNQAFGVVHVSQFSLTIYLILTRIS